MTALRAVQARGGVGGVEVPGEHADKCLGAIRLLLVVLRTVDRVLLEEVVVSKSTV